jgi:cold shock CspA family protein
MRGKLKWYNVVKGYGFVVADGKEYFFHHTDVVDPDAKARFQKSPGLDVEFDEVAAERGPKAAGVRVSA